MNIETDFEKLGLQINRLGEALVAADVGMQEFGKVIEKNYQDQRSRLTEVERQRLDALVFLGMYKLDALRICRTSRLWTLR